MYTVSVYRWQYSGSERLNDLPEVTHQAKAELRLRTQAVLIITLTYCAQEQP